MSLLGRSGPHRFTHRSALAVGAGFALLLAACSSAPAPAPAPRSEVGTPTIPAAAPAAATAAAVAPLTLTVRDSAIGGYLATSEGKALYVFLKDVPGKSNCAAACQAVWPPLMLKAGQEIKAEATVKGAFGTTDLTDGKQVTYNGAPLYQYAKDAQAGDMTGQNVGGVWFVARPDTASTAAVVVKTDGPKAPYLVGPDGLALYTYTKDTAGASNCAGTCLASWPALALPDGLAPAKAPAAAGEVALLKRTEGINQVLYKGQALYRFKGDAKPGDVSGDGVSGVWALARP